MTSHKPTDEQEDALRNGALAILTKLSEMTENEQPNADTLQEIAILLGKLQPYISWKAALHQFGTLRAAFDSGCYGDLHAEVFKLRLLVQGTLTARVVGDNNLI